MKKRITSVIILAICIVMQFTLVDAYSLLMLYIIKLKWNKSGRFFMKKATLLCVLS